MNSSRLQPGVIGTVSDLGFSPGLKIKAWAKARSKVHVQYPQAEAWGYSGTRYKMSNSVSFVLPKLCMAKYLIFYFPKVN
jgi:hypothetical protein